MAGFEFGALGRSLRLLGVRILEQWNLDFEGSGAQLVSRKP